VIEPDVHGVILFIHYSRLVNRELAAVQEKTTVVVFEILYEKGEDD
jgi:hypothetical protein